MKSQLKRILFAIANHSSAVKKMLPQIKLTMVNHYLLSESEIIRGEKDFETKRVIVNKYRRRWPHYTTETNKMIDSIMSKAPSLKIREDKDDIRTDMLFCRFAYGFLPEEYLCFHLEKKSLMQKREFVSDTDRTRYVAYMNDLLDYNIFMDKFTTYAQFKKYYKRDAIAVSKKEHFKTFENFVEKHPMFVSKQVSMSKGDSVTLVNMLENGLSTGGVFDKLIKDGKHIIEERIVQSATMCKLNASSVNTVRCVTLNTRRGIAIPYCFLKVGRNGSFVDNGGAGGLLVGIDCDTGICNTDGFDEYNERFVRHPNTEIAFKGFQMPDWKQMISICKEMSQSVPSIKFIGWDMAHTDNGWVVVEGNGSMQLIGPQIVWEKGIKREFEENLKSMDLLV